MAETTEFDPRLQLLGGAATVFRALEARYAGSDISELTPGGFFVDAMTVAGELREKGEMGVSELLLLPQLHVIAQIIGGVELGTAVKNQISRGFMYEL